MKRIHIILLTLAALLTLTVSCDYRKYADAEYPEDNYIYFPAARYNSAVWTIDGKAIPTNYTGNDNKSFQDVVGNDLCIHLGIVQAGIELKNIKASIAVDDAFIRSKVDAGKVPQDAVVLPASAINFPSSLELNSANDAVYFDLKVDKSFLLDSRYDGKSFVTALKLTSSDAVVTEALESVAILIKPAFLKQ